MPNNPHQGETRSVSLPIEKRADGKTIGGYAAVFRSPTSIGGYFTEIIAPGAFTKALQSTDVRALYDHKWGRVLGRTSTGTLRLKEDDKGLAAEIDLPDTTDGRDVRALMERGDLDGMSFLFRAVREEWDETTSPPTRTLLEAELYEVSVVADPAYPDATVAMRSREKAREEAEQDHAEHNRKQAEARIAERKAAAEQKFRRIPG